MSSEEPTEKTALLGEYKKDEEADKKESEEGEEDTAETKSGLLGSVTGKVTGLARNTSSAMKNVAKGTGNVIVGAASKTAGAGAGLAHVVAGSSRAGLGKLGQGYGKTMNGYDKIFYKHKNRTFGDHLEVASRGATFVVLCALPFVIPSAACPLCQEIIREGFYNSACITYFIYTLYVYTGDILHFAQGGVMGTILAVLSIWMMQGFMPGGYTEEMPHRFWLGSLWGIVFVFLVLWLNFDDNTRIFALSTYVWYWMSFLKPGFTHGFSQNFEININGKAVREFMVAVIGCGFAVIAAYVPYPIFAHNKAMEIAKDMLSKVFIAKTDFLIYYSGAEPDAVVVAALAKQMDTLQSKKGEVTSLLDSAWYECLGLGKAQIQRVMMSKFSNYVTKTIDLMSNTFQICQDEKFDGAHVTMMDGIRDTLKDIVAGNGEILAQCVEGLENGSFTEEMKTTAEKHKADVQETLEALIAKLESSRVAAGMNTVSEDVSGENVAVITYGEFVRLTAELYDSLQGEQKEERSWKDGAGIRGIFEPAVIFQPDHIMWVLRNFTSIIIAFYLGWMGYNRYIAKYNAALASTVAVLLSKFVGSAMIKNLARLQGVVLGIVLGNLLYAFLAWCYWWGHLLVGLALYFWTLLGLFMYFHSANYATTGLLLVVFGAQSLLRPCANENTDPSGHSAIVNVTCAICIMTIVDIFLSPARASDLAIRGFRDAYQPTIKALEQLFDDAEPKSEPGHGQLTDAVGAAKSMGNEASLEPRYYRHDWPTQKFNSAISCLSTMLLSMHAIKAIVLLEDGTKSKVFLATVQLDKFKELKELLIEHAQQIMALVEENIGDEQNQQVFGDPVELINEMKAHKHFGKKWAKAMDDFCLEVNTKLIKEIQGMESASHLADPLAEICMVVESLKAMFSHLDSVLVTLVA